jgi:hypothetical protein
MVKYEADKDRLDNELYLVKHRIKQYENVKSGSNDEDLILVLLDIQEERSTQDRKAKRGRLSGGGRLSSGDSSSSSSSSATTPFRDPK